MKLLLDTHVLLWWSNGDSRLSGNARNAIESTRNTVLVSAVSPWEIAIKLQLGRLKLPAAKVSTFMTRLARYLDFEELPIRAAHSCALQQLPSIHRDPFDRMLLAQTKIENATLVTIDSQLREYPVPMLW